MIRFYSRFRPVPLLFSASSATVLDRCSVVVLRRFHCCFGSLFRKRAQRY